MAELEARYWVLGWAEDSLWGAGSKRKCHPCSGISVYGIAEVGKAQLEAQSATSATSAIVEVALRFNFLFWNIAVVALRTTVFNICCDLIALRFHFFFQLIAQFFTLNLILFHFDGNIDKCWPSTANYFLLFCQNSKKLCICIVL